MEKRLVFSIIFIALITFLIFSFTGKKRTGNFDKFAQCLTRKKVSMYGSEGCGYCINQKRMFGDSFDYINYIECSKNLNICREKGINAYPTWVVNGKKHLGEQTLERLSELTGCRLS